MHALVRAALVSLVCLASGTLECGGRQLTVVERRGAQVYHRMCSVCHGAEGQGYAADRAPQLANAVLLATASDNYLKTAVGEGRSGTTMSAWSGYRGGPLNLSDIEAVVAYLRAWQPVPGAPQEKLDERPPQGDPKRGESVYARTCSGCHGEHGTEGPYVSLAAPELQRVATTGFLRAAIRRGRPGTPMPAFGDRLDDGAIEDVLAYVRSWQQQQPVVAFRPPAPAPPLPLGPVPLHPRGPEPQGFRATPQTTPADVVKQQLDRGARLALLDARAPSDYTVEHITGAVSVPFYDPDPYVAQLPRDAWLVAYCSCPHAESGTLAQKLAAKGFTKVTVLDEGLRVWKARGYPVSSGIDP